MPAHAAAAPEKATTTAVFSSGSKSAAGRVDLCEKPEPEYVNPRQQLARNLSNESEAYGYTLTIWGGGSILINQYGTPAIRQIFFYIGGALVGFAVLAAIAFPHLFTEHETAKNRQLIIASTIHIVATFGSLALAYLIIRTDITTTIPAWASFSLIGFQLTFTYNLFVLIERVVGRVVAAIHPNINER